MNSLRPPFIFFILFSLIIVSIPSAYASPDVFLTVVTDKSIYLSEEEVSIQGTLERDGTPVPNALVAVQVNNKDGNIVTIRTKDAGRVPSPWSICITAFYPCDQFGGPKDTFIKGTLAFFNVSLKNLDEISKREFIVTINLYDSNKLSFAVTWMKTQIDASTDFWCLFSMPIPEDVSVGAAYAFANAYNEWPKENGIAYCGEEAVSFTITDGAGSSGSDGSASSQSLGSEGTYELTFRLRSNPALGDYTVYGSYYHALATTNFDVVWLFTDINRDGKVNVGDLFLIAKAFGSQPEASKWNPKADVNDDNLINILDLFRVAKDFGKTRT